MNKAGLPGVAECPAAWVEFVIIDDTTGKPLENIPLKITLPNGAAQRRSTNSQGKITLTGIPVGVCAIESHPEDVLLTDAWSVVRLEHRVPADE